MTLHIFDFALPVAFSIAIGLAVVLGCIIAFKSGGKGKQDWRSVDRLLTIVLSLISALAVAEGMGESITLTDAVGLWLVVLAGTALMTATSTGLWWLIFKGMDNRHAWYGDRRQLNGPLSGTRPTASPTALSVASAADRTAEAEPDAASTTAKAA